MELLLVLSILTGQLVKIPLAGNPGLILLDLAVIIFSFWGLIKLKFHLKKPTLLITLPLLFFFVSVTCLAVTPLKLSLQQNLISLSYGIRFFIYVLFGWVIYSKGLPAIHPSRVFKLSAIGLSILGLIQLIFLPDLGFITPNAWDPHYFRAVSTYLDPNFLGVFLVLPFFPFPQAAILLYIAILTTFSRSSYLMLLITGLVFALLTKSKNLAIITIILFVGLIFSFNLYTNLVAKPRNIDRIQSASYRLGTWQQGVEIFLKSPLTGVGFNAYKFALVEYNLGNDQFLESRGSTYNDSSLLSVLATTGILGFGTYLAWLGMTLIHGLKSKNFLFVSCLIGLIITSFFNNVLFYPPILLWIILSEIKENG